MRQSLFVDPALKSEFIGMGFRNYVAFRMAINDTARRFYLLPDQVLLLLAAYVIKTQEVKHKRFVGYIKSGQLMDMYNLITGLKSRSLATAKPLKEAFYLERYKRQIGKFVLTQKSYFVINELLRSLDEYVINFEENYLKIMDLKK